MSSTCPSSSHQLVAASIAFRRARREFPKNLGLRSRSGYFYNESKETSPGNVKSGSSWRKQIQYVKSNNLYSPKTRTDDNRKATYGLLTKNIKRRPETSCSCCKCYGKSKDDDDDTKEIKTGKLETEKSAGDVNNGVDLTKNYCEDTKLSFDYTGKHNFAKLHRGKKSSWFYKPNSSVRTKSTDNRSRAHEMAALSVVSDRLGNSKNDPEAQYDLLASYATPRLDQDDFTGRFYDWENRNHSGLSVKTIPRNGAASPGGCSCFEQSSEIASRQESCLKPSFVKAQQFKRIYDKESSRGRSGYVKRGNKCPNNVPLISTTLQEQEVEVVPMEHKDSITILVEKFGAGTKMKNQDARNFGNINDFGTRSLKNNYKVNCHESKKTAGCRTNFESIRDDFQNMISKNPRSRANRMWRHRF